MNHMLAKSQPGGAGIHIEADLRQPLTGEAQQELRELFAQYGWLCFKGQSLTLDEQIGIMSLLLDKVTSKEVAGRLP